MKPKSIEWKCRRTDMEKHLKFKKGQQTLFLKSVALKSSLTIDGLALIVGTSPRNFRDWKAEKNCMAKSAAEKLGKQFGVDLPEKIEILENRWTKYKSEKARIGGFAFKNIYGNPATPEGRIKGGKKAMSILRKRGMVPLAIKFKHPKYSERLSEFVGIMLGDGGITPSQIQITLNSVTDKEYLHFVVALCSNLFGIYPKVFKKKDCNANVVYYNGVKLIEILKDLGLKTGNKVKQQVGVPDWIKSNKKYSIACLRGLMDTDGGIFTHKYKVNGKIYEYNKVCFTNSSIPLLGFVYKTLIRVGLNPKPIESKKIVNKKVWLYNSNEAKEYLESVGSSNQRLLKFKNLF